MLWLVSLTLLQLLSTLWYMILFVIIHYFFHANNIILWWFGGSIYTPLYYLFLYSLLKVSHLLSGANYNLFMQLAYSIQWDFHMPEGYSAYVERSNKLMHRYSRPFQTHLSESNGARALEVCHLPDIGQFNFQL